MAEMVRVSQTATAGIWRKEPVVAGMVAQGSTMSGVRSSALSGNKQQASSLGRVPDSLESHVEPSVL